MTRASCPTKRRLVDGGRCKQNSASLTLTLPSGVRFYRSGGSIEPRYWFPESGKQATALSLSTYAVKSARLPGREMRDLRLDEAAAVLCVSPDTLQAWERRFSFPHQVAGAAGQHRYERGEVFALRETLKTGLSVASAIDRARAHGTDRPPPSPR